MAQKKKLAFEKYLKSHNAPKDKKKEYTHTRIGNKDLNIFGGTYIFKDSEVDEFYKKYYQHVFIHKQQEFLTEKQLFSDGPLLIDLDLRYETSVKNRQHNFEDHVLPFIDSVMDEVTNVLSIKTNKRIPIYIMQKKNVNRLDDVTKDGIHIIIGLKMDKVVQMMIRNRVLNKIKEDDIWEDLPYTNTWDEIYDEGVAKGHVNWQLYGSRKPGYEAYEVTNICETIFEEEEDEWSYFPVELKDFKIKTNIQKLSARYTNHIEFELRKDVDDEYEKMKKKVVKNKNKKVKMKLKANTNLDDIDYDQIDSQASLDQILNDVMNTEHPKFNYQFNEIYYYTMALPDSYYGPGSYNKWIRVGWALKNTSKESFLIWLKLSSQSVEFTYEQVPDMYEMWMTFEKNNEDGLTYKSIMYWVRTDNKTGFDEIRNKTVDYYVEYAIAHNGLDYDIANVLFNLYKHKYICVSLKNSIWYEFVKGRWIETEGGVNLSLKISTDVFREFMKKCMEYQDKTETLSTEEEIEKNRQTVNKIMAILNNCKKTTAKKNFMKQAAELFYDSKFYQKLDSNPFLLACKNGVIDFKTKTFRRGEPTDYISKSTNINYIKDIDTNKEYTNTTKEVETFMEQIFPNKNLRRYMWEHLASCLIGTNENQTFNIYTGSGANGKSKLVDLMTKVMGDYKGTVPITLITQKRVGIGNTSSEVVQLMGKRYAVMQEPSKNERINEGIMKEITGGDPIQARALFKETVTFTPQFNLVVCTNTLFDIRSNDDGTWRRIRLVDFESKFHKNPYKDEKKFPKEMYPHQYLIDTKIDQKFEAWGPIMLSLLTKLAFETNGKVEDCQEVLASSDKYRSGQDFFAAFINEKIRESEGEYIKVGVLRSSYKDWLETTQGRSGFRASDLYERMTKIHGVKTKKGWKNVQIKHDDDSSSDEEDDGEDDEEISETEQDNIDAAF